MKVSCNEVVDVKLNLNREEIIRAMYEYFTKRHENSTDAGIKKVLELMYSKETAWSMELLSDGTEETLELGLSMSTGENKWNTQK